MAKLLVLVIDRDNDVGLTLGVKGPIVGFKSLREIADEFAIKRPEDSDLNAIFTALKIYNEKKSQSEDIEVALVLGDAYDDLKADKNISEQLQSLKSSLGFEEIIFICDSPEDERAIPVILGYGKIIGIKRVVVEQWRSVEETYILIGRYIKKAISEPRLSRFFLGVPGIVVLSLVLLNYLGLTHYALLAIGVILGAAMIVRGFNLEDKIYSLWGSSPIMFIASFFSSAFLILTMALIYTSISDRGFTPSGIGIAISSASPFAGIAAFSILLGKSIIKILRRDIKIWRDIVGMVIVVVAIIAFQELGVSISTRMSAWTTSELINAIVSSGFIEITLIGIGITGLMTLFSVFIEKKYSSKD